MLDKLEEIKDIKKLELLISIIQDRIDKLKADELEVVHKKGSLQEKQWD